MLWRLLLLFALVAASAPLAAQETHDIDIRPSSLDSALGVLARQTGASIGGIDRAVSNARSPRIRGPLTVRRALERMLASTPFTYREVSTGTYRIVRRPAAPRRVTRRAARPTPAPPVRAQPPQPPTVIVVTASKLGTNLDEYSGTAHVFDAIELPLSASSSGLESLVAGLPTITQTNLGPGRNKLFIRGIADSSFNGSTQSTVAQYYNDVRLTYSAPNPDMRLYDTERVEIIEGPQGSLYGAGSIGGIVRTVTKPANPSGFAATVWGGGAITMSGSEGYNVAGMVNVPLSEDIAVRLLSYQQMDGGYIDDTLRGLSDVNRAMIAGTRVSAHWSVDDSTQIDLVAAYQSSETNDSQYTDIGGPPLSRASLIAQPFENDLALYSLTFRKRFGDLSVVSASGYVENRFETRFDASGDDPLAPTAFDERRDINLFSHETRATFDGDSLRWLVGASFVKQTDSSNLYLGPALEPPLTTSSQTQISEVALFGETDWRIDSDWTLSGGGRIVYSENTTEQMIADIEPTRRNTRFLPTAALRWSPNPDSAIYLRYQTGYRVGGIAISGGTDPEVSNVDADRVRTLELGIDYPIGDADRLTISHRFFYTEWSDVQADLIDQSGFPVIGNIGDGEVYGATLSASWRPVDMLQIDLSGFANDSEITDLEDSVSSGEDLRLPNIAELGVSGRVTLDIPVDAKTSLRLASLGRYVGSSQLGIQSFLDLPQGDYFQLNGSAELISDGWAIELSVANALNTQANRFAYGNPLSISGLNQSTPNRPLTVQLNLRVEY